MEKLRAWWAIGLQVALFLIALGAFFAKVDGYERQLDEMPIELRTLIHDLQGEMLRTNNAQDERGQMMVAEVTRRLDEFQNRILRLETPYFNRKDAGLVFMYAEVEVEEPYIRPLIYDKEIDELERDVAILQTLLGVKGISKEAYNTLNDRLWEKQTEKDDLLLRQQVCEFDDQRRALCWAEYLSKPAP